MTIVKLTNLLTTAEVSAIVSIHVTERSIAVILVTVTLEIICQEKKLSTMK